MAWAARWHRIGGVVMKDRIERFGQHIWNGLWVGTRSFPPATLQHVEREILESEALHDGEIRFVVEGALRGHALLHNQSPRERALDLFSQYRMWDTKYRNAVLIYVLLADHTVEIVADRGLREKTRESEWSDICNSMETDFRLGRYEQAALNGVRAVSHILHLHYHKPQAQTQEHTDMAISI